MRRVLSLLVVLLLSPVVLLAQAAEPMPDPKAAGAQAILALTPILGLFVVWGIKLVFAKIPANLVLFVVPVVGIAINYGLSYLNGLSPADPLIAALVSMAATWLRELATTAPKGLSSVTVTKGMF